MTPLEQVIAGLTLEYERGPRTPARRKQLMEILKTVLDYFIPVSE